MPPNGQVVAEVYADQPGKAYDIAPSRFSIPGLPTEMQQDIYAVSAKPMSGGGTMVGVVTQNDIDNAAQDFKDKVKDAYTATNTTSSTTILSLKGTILPLIFWVFSCPFPKTTTKSFGFAFFIAASIAFARSTITV